VVKGTVSPVILILFMMLIIKSVLFVWPLVPLRFLYGCFNFIFVSNVIIYILPVALELAKSSLKLLANLASAFSKVTGTLTVIFLKSLENGLRLF
jgi:predicted neutral ceramidase superfamily lipid hydrolase